MPPNMEQVPRPRQSLADSAAQASTARVDQRATFQKLHSQFNVLPLHETSPQAEAAIERAPATATELANYANGGMIYYGAQKLGLSHDQAMERVNQYRAATDLARTSGYQTPHPHAFLHTDDGKSWQALSPEERKAVYADVARALVLRHATQEGRHPTPEEIQEAREVSAHVYAQQHPRMAFAASHRVLDNQIAGKPAFISPAQAQISVRAPAQAQISVQAPAQAQISVRAPATTPIPATVRAAAAQTQAPAHAAPPRTRAVVSAELAKAEAARAALLATQAQAPAPPAAPAIQTPVVPPRTRAVVNAELAKAEAARAALLATRAHSTPATSDSLDEIFSKKPSNFEGPSSNGRGGLASTTAAGSMRSTSTMLDEIFAPATPAPALVPPAVHQAQVQAPTAQTTAAPASSPAATPSGFNLGLSPDGKGGLVSTAPSTKTQAPTAIPPKPIFSTSQTAQLRTAIKNGQAERGTTTESSARTTAAPAPNPAATPSGFNLGLSPDGKGGLVSTAPSTKTQAPTAIPPKPIFSTSQTAQLRTVIKNGQAERGTTTESSATASKTPAQAPAAAHAPMVRPPRLSPQEMRDHLNRQSEIWNSKQQRQGFPPVAALVDRATRNPQAQGAGSRTVSPPNTARGQEHTKVQSTGRSS